MNFQSCIQQCALWLIRTAHATFSWNWTIGWKHFCKFITAKMSLLPSMLLHRTSHSSLNSTETFHSSISKSACFFEVFQNCDRRQDFHVKCWRKVISVFLIASLKGKYSLFSVWCRNFKPKFQVFVSKYWRGICVLSCVFLFHAKIWKTRERVIFRLAHL